MTKLTVLATIAAEVGQAFNFTADTADTAAAARRGILTATVMILFAQAEAGSPGKQAHRLRQALEVLAAVSAALAALDDSSSPDS